MKKGLGRGLDSLFGVYENTDVTKEEKLDAKVVKLPADLDGDLTNDEVLELPLNEIDTNVNQPRKVFDENALKELSDSIKTHGVIQPIIVVKMGERYMIIAGERRFRASKLAGLTTIPAIVKNYNEKEIAEVSLLENLQREDLNPMECARAMKKLMTDFGWTQEIVADRLGKSRPVVANTIRLLNLEPEVIDMIEKGKLSAGHARSLVAVTDKKAQIKLAKQVMEKKLTVRDLEKAVRSVNNPRAIATQSSELKDLIDNMKRVLGTKVSVLGTDQRGRIYIDYYSRADLDRIYDCIEKLK
ncbi:MAG: ParB/RepB/Spo0J family partition protein [Christensenellales bacterium]